MPYTIPGPEGGTKDVNINYEVSGPEDGTPIMLVHGFGASINHWRYNEKFLTSLGYRVVRLDLLGFGASDKPPPSGSFDYNMELFESVALKVVETVEERGEVKGDKKWIVGGNSIGGLTALMVGRTMQDRCKGVVLFNTSGGMTSFRYEELPVLLRPILWFVQNMLKRYGNGFWEKFKQPENVEQILKGQVYRDNTNVDEELLDVILNPSYDEGAREVFLAVFGGEAGPTPEDIIGEYKNGKILALWGTGDTWTPLDGGLHPGSRLGEYVKEGVEFELVRLEGAGHCPHDETPDLCHKFLGPWLVNLE